jgi:cytochrome b561
MINAASIPEVLRLEAGMARSGLSAARYPIVLYGSVHLPPILPHSVMLYAVLRRTHTVLAYLLVLTFIAHFGAVLFHTLIVRDGMFSRMAPWRVRAS